LERDDAFRELYDEGLTDGEIARRTDSDKDRVRRWRQREKLPSNYLRTGEEVEREYLASISKPQDNWAAGVPRPIQVNIPQQQFVPPADGDFFRQFSLSDTHFPFHDPAYINVILQVLADYNPHLVVHHGDIVDCYKISKYEQNPRHRPDMQDEIRMAAEFLGQISAVTPNAKRKLIKGNHEDRLRKIIWDRAQKDPQMAQILQLPSVWDALQWPQLLGLQSSGWEWIENKEKLFDKLILKHGTVVRKKSAYTASGEYEKYGKSGMSGHTHRVGSYYHTDHNGPHAWYELGCGCKLDPDYCEDPDWQQGFAVVTWSPDRTRYSVEQVIVHDGTAIFRGKLYGA
jgi:predicted phosphodiesterase